MLGMQPTQEHYHEAATTEATEQDTAT